MGPTVWGGVIGPARAGEKGTPCAPAGPSVRGQVGGCPRNCQRRAAGPSASLWFERGGSLRPRGHGKTGPGVLTREPGDLPMSRLQRLPGGVHREWEITMLCQYSESLRRPLRPDAPTILNPPRRRSSGRRDFSDDIFVVGRGAHRRPGADGLRSVPGAACLCPIRGWFLGTQQSAWRFWWAADLVGR